MRHQTELLFNEGYRSVIVSCLTACALYARAPNEVAPALDRIRFRQDASLTDPPSTPAL